MRCICVWSYDVTFFKLNITVVNVLFSDFPTGMFSLGILWVTIQGSSPAMIIKQALCATEDQVKDWSFYHGLSWLCLKIWSLGYVPGTHLPSLHVLMVLCCYCFFLRPPDLADVCVTTFVRHLTIQSQTCIVATLTHALRCSVHCAHLILTKCVIVFHHQYDLLYTFLCALCPGITMSNELSFF